MTNKILMSLSLAVLAVACDKSGADAENKASEARTTADKSIVAANREADKKVGEAVAEADKKVGEATSEADKKVAEARAEFAKTREDYRHSMQDKLDDIDKKLSEIDAKTKTMSGTAKTEKQARVQALRAQRDAFLADFRAMEGATASTWDATKARLEKEWTDLQAAVDKAT